MIQDFEVIGRIERIETIATGKRIRELARLRNMYGPGRWRKLKGVAIVSFTDGTIRWVELHWY
jgi:hypothetical protein